MVSNKELCISQITDLNMLMWEIRKTHEWQIYYWNIRINTLHYIYLTFRNVTQGKTDSSNKEQITSLTDENKK